MKSKCLILVSVVLCAVALHAQRPVVFLHGWGSDGGIWGNMKNLLKANDYYVDSDLHAFSYYGSSFGYSKSTPIQTVAEGVAREISEIYYENGCKPVDLVTHSMGGLVVRAMLAYDLIDSKCIDRFISIAAPNYGQNLDDGASTAGLGGYQASQMKYGSLFLWELADAWHFKKKKIVKTLCIAGIEQSVNGSKWDGLVHSWSASLDDAPVRYVNKCHSPTVAKAAKSNTVGGGIVGFIVGGVFGGIIGAVVGNKTADESNVIYKCHDGKTDDVYVLVSDYLADGWAYPQSRLKQDTVPSSVADNGGFFFQIVDNANNPAQYPASSSCLVHTYMHPSKGRIIADYLEHGLNDHESQYMGVEMVYGTMPQGKYTLTGYASQTTPAFTAYGVPVHGGKMTVVRIRAHDGCVLGAEAKLVFNSMGGTPVESQRRYIGDYADDLPKSIRSGYRFEGWYTMETGGDRIYEHSLITTCELSLYAHWTKEEVTDYVPKASTGDSVPASEPGTPTIVSEVLGVLQEKALALVGKGSTWISASYGTTAYTTKKARTMKGALYTVSGAVYGTVVLKLGPVNSKKKVKVSGTVYHVNGKKYSIIAKTVKIQSGTPTIAKLKVKTLGTLEVAIGGDGIFGLIGKKFIVQTAKVGGNWTRDGSALYVDFGDGAKLPKNTLIDLLPLAEPIYPSSGKWAFAKTGIKTAKRSDGTYKLIAGKEVANPAAVKIAYTPSTGAFKGTFRIYTGTTAKAKMATVAVTGVVVDGSGIGRAKLKKPAATWIVVVDVP